MTGALALTAGSMPAASAASAATAAPAAVKVSTTTTTLRPVGTVNVRTLAAKYAKLAKEKPTAKTPTARSNMPLRKLPSAGHASAPALTGTPPPATSTSVSSITTGNVTGERGFIGINAPVSAAENPAIGDVTPPDQGLAVGPFAGGKAAVEMVNLALNFTTVKGHALFGPIPDYALFGLPADAYLTDPRVMYDAGSGHWFFTMFTFGDGNFAPLSTQYVAVTSGKDLWYSNISIFAIDTSDHLNTGAGCPCFGDFDMIGADANGFYISTNKFSVDGPQFDGTVIYAMSKNELASYANGGPVPALQTYTLDTNNDPFASYHLSPSSVPKGGYQPSTEYFVESNATLPYDNSTTGKGLEVFALLHTGLLNSDNPPPLVGAGVNTISYSQPPTASQKNGFGTQLQTDFDAVQQVTYTGGRLYAELNSGFNYNGHRRSDVEWFVLKPSLTSTSISGITVVRNGRVKTSQFLLYPDIGVDKYGHGFIAFALSGPGHYPSAAYIKFTVSKGAYGAVHIAAGGYQQLNDFTCYLSIGGCRYGDYSMAEAYNGRIYMATEYVPPTPGDFFTNWGTRVWSAPVP